MLDRRKAAVLRAIVRDYVRTGQPVGSKAVAGRARIRVSSATIRNDMALLEELGYIQQPYTSAGRVPTDEGYRWFIDNWPGPTWPELPERAQQTIEGLVTSEFRGLEEALEETSQVLSDLTDATAVVVAPPSRKDLLKRVELLPRDDRRATLLLIADTGVVEQGVVEFSEARSEEQLSRLAEKLNDELDGVAFEEIPSRLTAGASGPAVLERGGRTTGGQEPDRAVIASEIDKILSSRTGDRIFRGGTANILSPDKFADISTAHEVVEALEQPTSLTKLVQAARQAGSILIFIGREVPVEQMRACAVVFAPYDVGSDRHGTLGVVGPTRMDYPRTISAVESMARSLSEWLDSSGV